jgi:hypothetical protein
MGRWSLVLTPGIITLTPTLPQGRGRYKERGWAGPIRHFIDPWPGVGKRWCAGRSLRVLGEAAGKGDPAGRPHGNWELVLGKGGHMGPLLLPPHPNPLPP